MKQTIEEKIEIPTGVTITIDKNRVVVKGLKGETSRIIPVQSISANSDGKMLTITAKKATKKEKTHLYSTISHLKNMVKGVTTPYKYVLKICSGHFPMNVSITGGNFVIKNFLGEKFPRTMPLKQGATVTIQGDKITVESPSKEMAGQTASEIELLTFVSKRDPRIFQDGIYLIEKDGAPLK